MGEMQSAGGAAIIWRCPLCAGPLVTGDKLLRCDRGHCFDIARQGYVNLLPVNAKRSKDPGDDKSMVQARRAFLDAGFYQPLVAALAEIQAEALQGCHEGALCALDMGGGDGYFSAALAQLNTDLNWFLSDISKSAVRLAGARFAPLHCAVASSFKLPVADGSVHWLLRNFAPSEEREVARVLHAKGYYCVVTPVADHLIELRQHLYQTARQHAEPAIDPSFSLVARRQVSYRFELVGEQQRRSLLAMTPMAWHANAGAMEAWLRADQHTVSANFLISVYQPSV